MFEDRPYVPGDREIAERMAFNALDTFTSRLQRRYTTKHPTTGAEINWPPTPAWVAWLTLVIEVAGGAMVLWVIGWFIYSAAVGNW